MKLDVDIESIEGGWVVRINENKRFCKSPLDITRLIFDVYYARVLPSDRKKRYNDYLKAEISQKIKKFWADKVGSVQRLVIESMKEDGYATVSSVYRKILGKRKHHGYDRALFHCLLGFQIPVEEGLHQERSREKVLLGQRAEILYVIRNEVDKRSRSVRFLPEGSQESRPLLLLPQGGASQEVHTTQAQH